MGELGRPAPPPTPPSYNPTHLREVSLLSCDFRQEHEQMYSPKCQTGGSFKTEMEVQKSQADPPPPWDFSKVLLADVTQTGLKLTELSGDWWNHGILSNLWDCFKIGLSSQSHCCRGRRDTRQQTVETLNQVRKAEFHSQSLHLEALWVVWMYLACVSPVWGGCKPCLPVTDFS